MAIERGHLAGYPMPVEGLRLNLVPGCTPKNLADFDLGGSVPERYAIEDDPEVVRVRNSWFSSKLGREVFVVETKTRVAELIVGLPPWFHRWRMESDTASAAMAWQPEAELKALETLETLVGADRAGRYRCSGLIVETSRRSGLLYMFRRLRPTIVMRHKTPGGDWVPLCALCLHPIGYYRETWAGSMVPTDDVMAHLLLMRGDEPMLWRRANQHPIWAPEAGI